MQVAVDINTAPAVFEAVEAAAVAHFKANPTEFSGEKMIIANVVGDPLKFLLCVWWEYAYPGMQYVLASHHGNCYIRSLHHHADKPLSSFPLCRVLLVAMNTSAKQRHS